MISHLNHKILWAGFTLIFTIMMANIVIPYFSESWDYGFLITKLDIIHFSYYRIAFMLHIISSLFVIGTGAFLFLNGRGKLWWRFHRCLGRIYIGLVLLIAAPTGLVMGYHANGGVMGQVNFILLSILWWWFTYKGFETIRKGDVNSHKRWMLRSYALTLSAVTLRFLQMIIPMSWYTNPALIYVVVSWFSWVLNLLIVELSMIYNRKAVIS